MKILIVSLICCVSLLQLSCQKDDTDAVQYRFSEKIMFDGRERTYTIHLPDNYYNTDTEKPLVVGLHGTGGSAEQFEKDYGFSEKADEAGFIAVYPDGVQKADGRLTIRTWNAGSCCDYAMYSKVDDVKFITSVIEAVSGKFKVNRKKVYLAGMSNGSMMAYRVAAERPGLIAAMATVSGSMVYNENISQQGIVPVLHIHSLLDTKVPFAGGKGLSDYDFPPAINGIHYWAQRNGCDTTAAVQKFDGYEQHSWMNGDGDILVSCYLTYDGGHAWPGSEKNRQRGDEPSKVINANELIWDFFERFELP
jgi:polyhydroxybutyrate depolymerase